MAQSVRTFQRAITTITGEALKLSGRKTRVAVVGVGGIGNRVHVPAYKNNNSVDLIALVDTDEKTAKRVARKFNVKRVFSSTEELFKSEEIDAVSICTPPDSHAKIALQAFANGAHVLCEKPLANDLSAGSQMVRASKAKDKILIVGCNRRFTPNYQEAKRCILRGDIGHIYCIEDQFVEPNPLFSWTKSAWFLDPGVGGVLNDLGPHIFDLFNYLFDEYPIAVSAFKTTYLNSPVEESSSFIVEYPGGRSGIGKVSWLSSTVMESIGIYGTAQNLFASPNFLVKINPNDIQEVALWRAASESLLSLKFPKLSFLRVKRDDPYQREIDSFIKRIRGSGGFSKDALNALSVLAACKATQEAATKRCRIEIPKPEEL